MELTFSESVKPVGEADLEENKSSVSEISFRCLLDIEVKRLVGSWIYQPGVQNRGLDRTYKCGVNSV